jgi:hypothetical protein
VDLNGDGYHDILSGSYSRTEKSMAGLFQVLWGQAGGKFKPAAALNGTDGESLIIPIKGESEQTENICTRPTAVDWNGDGKLDLVVGNFAGTFYLFSGQGSGKFAPKPEPLTGGQGRLMVKGAHGDPFVVDWDGDGDLDLLSGTGKGGVQWAENSADRGQPPALKPFEALIKPGPAFEIGQLISEKELIGPAGSTRVWADDVDGDGKLDLLVGDTVTLVAKAKGVSDKEYAQKLTKWKEAWNAASEAMGKARNNEERTAAQKTYSEVYQQRTEFMHEDRTGYVWLYRRQ